MSLQEVLGLQVAAVRPGSVAWRVGLSQGDVVLEINGQKTRDEIDYFYLGAGEKITVRYCNTHGVYRSAIILKDYDQDLGISLATSADHVRRCRNRCIFCFVDQMPPGLRPSLYIKDDDYRLSFVHGNFITLTNLSRADLDRIIRLRLSPLYISVHSTDEEMRRLVLGRRRLTPILPILRQFAGARIEMHTQMVLCPGVNDGPSLWTSVEDLAALWPAVRSVALVPVGLTRFRQGGRYLQPYTQANARDLIEQVAAKQRQFLKTNGTRFIFPADEFYLVSGQPLPESGAYEGYPQVENGVGLTRLFWDSFKNALDTFPDTGVPAKNVLVVTGSLAAGTMATAVARVKARFPLLTAKVVAVTNEFLGPSVTVAGLVSGVDIIARLQGAVKDDPCCLVLLPRVMFKDGIGPMLDGMNPGQVARRLGRPVRIVETSGAGLVRGLLA